MELQISAGWLVGVGISLFGLVYAYMRNFKADIIKRIDRFETRMDSQDERIFLLSTGKTLSQAILEEKMKKKEG